VSVSADVIVIGGGAVGVCCALELAKQGASVSIVERGGELAWACSSGNAGLICPSHATPLANPGALRDGLRWIGRPDSPFYLRPRPAVLPWITRFVAASTPERARAASLVIRQLSRASLAMHAELAEAGLDTAFETRGSLNVSDTEAGFAGMKKEAEDSIAAGLPAQVLEGGQARELEPSLAGDPAGAVFYPEDAHCDPYRFVQAVGRAAQDAGARVLTRTEVLGFRRVKGVVQGVQTTAGDLAASTVVLAAGAWSARLAKQLGVYVPVEGGKGYHVDLEPGTGDPRIPVWFHGSRVIATPLPGRLRLAGTLELAGLDESVSKVRVDAIVNAAKRGIRGLDGRRVIEVWRGLRPCSPDGLPIVGRPESQENVVVATGHGMMGLTLAPVTGRVVADLVAGETPGLDIRALRPGRFQPLLGRES
jgi:D-amino-acid dehydrogenase